MHSTFRSVALAIDETARMGLAVEWLVVVDSPDQPTREYLQRHLPDNATLIDVEFRDLGAARNRGTDAATGQYVAFIDSDDLWSPNWLTEAHAFAVRQTDRDFVLHAAFLIYFEGEEHIVIATDSLDPDFSPSALFSVNCWAVSSFAPREIYQRHPFTTVDLDAGFGYEDWHFNCETLAASIQHRLVPDTFQCYRKKTWKESLSSQTDKASCIINANKLFDVAFQKKMDHIRQV